MSFGLYILGFLLLIIGVAYGAHLAHVPIALDCRGRHRTTWHRYHVRGIAYSHARPLLVRLEY